MTVGNASFPKTSRLKLASDFRDLLRNGISFRQNGIAVYFKKSGQKKSRLGIIVSKRILKRAVDRNRIKRSIREFFRRERKNFNAHFDLVVRIQQNVNLFEDNNLQKYLKALLQAVKIL